MPVEFLTDEQAAAYGRFVEEPTRPELERFFFLDDVDRDLIASRRTTAHQLGFAVQMCTVRYVGRFLVDDPLDVPWSVVEHLTAQLQIEDASVSRPPAPCARCAILTRRSWTRTTAGAVRSDGQDLAGGARRAAPDSG
ncbi:DUF4158 domain-containing protein [Streptomyces sp. FXJ1.4098]|nr:DUF4158 domain-containing protein [Streptomyces sp. FXJ1.4098]